MTSSNLQFLHISSFLIFFFNDTATTEIYTLSLHDALPISHSTKPERSSERRGETLCPGEGDRKSTRLNSSHQKISYAGFCLKKKKTHIVARPSPRPPRSRPCKGSSAERS